MSPTQLIVASAWKGTLILICGFAGATAWRRASASIRHAISVTAFACLLALPLVLWFAPNWKLAVVAPAPRIWTPAIPTAAVALAGTAIHPPTVPWLLMVWMAGALAAVGWFLVGAARVFRLARRSAPADYGAEGATRVREGAEIPVPMAWGLWRPVVLLPLSARDWPPERLRSALLHETTHIRRGDLWIQVLSQAVCSAYWFHPLAWLAARQLRREREGACDDAVLRAGVAAPEYASHLMELARTLAGRHIHAPAMAEGSDLESRVRALLDRRRDRRPLSRGAAAAMTCASVAVLLPVAALHAHARRTSPPTTPLVLAPPDTPLPEFPSAKPKSAPPARVRLVAQSPAPRRLAPAPGTLVNGQVPPINGPISGVVLDPTGAVVPGCQVIARDMDRNAGLVTGAVARTDAAGRYGFDALPPGHYLLQFDVPGFTPALVMARDDAPQYVWLTVGSINESVVVGAPKPAVVGVAPAPGPQRIRVGGNVQPSRLISRTEPVYPPELQQLGIEGTVMIRAIISKTGEPTNLQVISTGIDPRLAPAALDSVSQWRYQPTLLNGQPVEVETTIMVDFKLEP
jgi:TonB family protein